MEGLAQQRNHLPENSFEVNLLLFRVFVTDKFQVVENLIQFFLIEQQILLDQREVSMIEILRNYLHTAKINNAQLSVFLDDEVAWMRISMYLL